MLLHGVLGFVMACHLTSYHTEAVTISEKSTAIGLLSILFFLCFMLLNFDCEMGLLSSFIRCAHKITLDHFLQLPVIFTACIDELM